MGFMDTIRKITGAEEEDDDQEYEMNNDDDSDYEESFGSRRSNNISSVPKTGKVLNIPATTRLQVIVFKAEKFTDDNTNKDVSNRLIDFLGGVAYATDGDLKRISNTSFILVPYNVDISGDLIEELGNNATDFM